jgi:addiction module HigA family antidote
MNRITSVQPPGEFIKAELEKYGWTQFDLAAIVGRPVQMISELCSGKKTITPRTAIQLAAAFGTEPILWLQRQNDYQLSMIAQDQEKQEKYAAVRERAREMAEAKAKQPKTSKSLHSATLQFVIDLLEARIRKILEISHREPEPHDCAESICFHLREIRYILEGNATCGVFDDYGPVGNERAGEPRGEMFGDSKEEK